MSGFVHASVSRRPRTPAVVLIVALFVFSALVITQSSLLQWPLASEIRNLQGFPNNQQSNQNQNFNFDSSILVSVVAYLPAVNPLNFLGIAEQPLSGANITVFANATTPSTGNLASPKARESAKALLIASKITDPSGKLQFMLPSGSYEVVMTTGIANLTTSVVARPQNTTELDIQVNETSYSASFFEIENPASPGLILPWESTYVRLDSSLQMNDKLNQSVYLRFIKPNSTTTCAGIGCFVNQTGNITGDQLIQFFLQQAVSARVISEFSSAPQGTLWLQVQTNSVVDVSNISGIDVLIALSFYTTKEYPMANQTSATFTG